MWRPQQEPDLRRPGTRSPLSRIDDLIGHVTLPCTGGSAENSQLAAPRKTADNPTMVGFWLKKVNFIFGYVGNLTDSFREQVRE